MIPSVRAKKHLGQHFLKDEQIAQQIVGSLLLKHHERCVLEIGPGMGILTKYLIQQKAFKTSIIDIDRESILYLQNAFPELKENILSGDFLKMRLDDYFQDTLAIIGNFPYNISSQILFKVLEHKNLVTEVVGMFQKEVAERIASVPKKKAYGILSVFMQAYYDVEYLFTVHEDVFNPPPKVKSAVIRFTRNKNLKLDCNEALFITVVKTGFNQRRKTLRNALKSILPLNTEIPFLSQRAEELSYREFEHLTNCIEKNSQVN
jgi:16S rRNA (adenine1518-N6/adenine1519-N6)-dimethyltransferase